MRKLYIDLDMRSVTLKMIQLILRLRYFFLKLHNPESHFSSINFSSSNLTSVPPVLNRLRFRNGNTVPNDRHQHADQRQNSGQNSDNGGRRNCTPYMPQSETQIVIRFMHFIHLVIYLGYRPEFGLVLFGPHHKHHAERRMTQGYPCPELCCENVLVFAGAIDASV